MENQIVVDMFYTSLQGLHEEYFEEKTGKNWYKHVMSIPKHLRITYLIVTFQQQFHNGGFEQYFNNDYGYLFILETIQAMKEVNALHEANLLQQLFDIINPHKKTLKLLREEYYSDGQNGDPFDNNTIISKLEKIEEIYYNSENSIKLLEVYLKEGFINET